MYGCCRAGHQPISEWCKVAERKAIKSESVPLSQLNQYLKHFEAKQNGLDDSLLLCPIVISYVVTSFFSPFCHDSAEALRQSVNANEKQRSLGHPSDWQIPKCAFTDTRRTLCVDAPLSVPLHLPILDAYFDGRWRRCSEKRSRGPVLFHSSGPGAEGLNFSLCPDGLGTLVQLLVCVEAKRGWKTRPKWGDGDA